MLSVGNIVILLFTTCMWKLKSPVRQIWEYLFLHECIYLVELILVVKIEKSSMRSLALSFPLGSTVGFTSFIATICGLSRETRRGNEFFVAVYWFGKLVKAKLGL